MRRIFLIAIFMSLLLIGKVEILFAQYSLQKITEFQIETLNSVEIVDFDPSNKTYLGYEKVSKGFVVLLTDEKGGIIQKKDLQGGGPGQFNSAMNLLGFNDEGFIWVITPNQMIVYDRNLNFQKSEKLDLENTFFTSKLTESPIFFYKGNSTENLIFSIIPSLTARFMRAKSLEKLHLVDLYDLKSKTVFHLAPIKERGIYKHLDSSIFTMYKPIFAQDKTKDLLFVTATLDNEITVIDLQSGKTLSNIKINHGDFASLKKLPISEKTLPRYPPYSLASLNRKILPLDGGFVVLDYVKEIPYGTYEKKKTEDPTYHHFQDSFYHRLILFGENKQFSEEILLPKNGRLLIGLPGNRLLFQITDPEVEEDFIQYDIYELVKD